MLYPSISCALPRHQRENIINVIQYENNRCWGRCSGMKGYLSDIPWCNFQELLFPFGMFIIERIQNGSAIISRKGKFNLFLIVWGHLLQNWCHLPDANSLPNSTHLCKCIYISRNRRNTYLWPRPLLGYKHIQLGSNDCESVWSTFLQIEQDRRWN